MREAGRLDEFKKLPRPRKTVEERFRAIGWTTTDKGCWEWNGARNPRGYGQLSAGPRDSEGKSWPLYAPRVSWELENGPIPDGMVACHKCDNPPCVNPGHLFLGTRADNNADMAAKRRTRNGERRPQHKLTDAQVRQIRVRYEAGGVSQRALADEYGVSQAAISLVVHSKRRAAATYPDPLAAPAG